MRIRAILLAALLGLLALAGCAAPQAPGQAEPTASASAALPTPGTSEAQGSMSIEYLTFEEAVSHCTDVLTGTFLGAEEAEGQKRYAFSVDERMKGAADAEGIGVYAELVLAEATEHSGTYLSGDLPYALGKKYLLILERHRSVYYDEDRYLLLGDIFLPLESAVEAGMYHEPLERHWSCPEGTDAPDYVRQLIAQGGGDGREAYGAAYIEASSFAEAEEAAELVLRVRALRLNVTGRIVPTETWDCRILETRKGDLSYLNGNMDVLITFPAGSVEAEREYWVCVNKPGKTSRIFVPVSRENSIREGE